MRPHRCRAKHQTATVRRVGYLDGSDGSHGVAFVISITCRFGHRKDIEWLELSTVPTRG